MMPVFALVGWLLGWILLARLPLLGDRSCGVASPETPRVSVLIPARNEADRLPILLRDIAAQTLTPFEVIVVDDNSDDDTARIADEFPFVRMVRADPPPEGWTGKTWACSIAADNCSGDILVFLDADVQLHRLALAHVVEGLSERGGLFSVQPRHDIAGPLEAASLPFNVVALMGLGIGSIFPPAHQWGAAGPCLATRREDYQSVGGHTAVRASVAEDLDLAAAYRSSGLDVRCVGGGSLVSFRMYRSLREVTTGWSKNIAAGAQRTPLLRMATIVVWFAAMTRVSIELVTAPLLSHGYRAPLVALCLYLAFTLQWLVFSRQVGRFRLASLFWPILDIYFLVIVILSTVRTKLLREVEWSGRQISLRRR